MLVSHSFCYLASAVHEQLCRWHENAILQRDNCYRPNLRRHIDTEHLQAKALGAEMEHSSRLDCQKAPGRKQRILHLNRVDRHIRAWHVQTAVVKCPCDPRARKALGGW